MQAEKNQFTKFISGEVTLVIPVYQRNYDWKVENCARLFEDILTVIKNNASHFIGTFVYQQMPVGGASQEYIIIDGQQRIASIILFAKALHDLIDDDDLREDIRSKFIRHTTGRGLRNKCRLRPTEYDSATFDKLMSDAAFDENKFTDDEKKSSAMYKNYRFFRDKISSSTVTAEEFCDAIGQLIVVSISLDANENAQEIFESLNSTGLDLSPADLIRNFLLMSLDYARQEELYKTYWLEIEKKFSLSEKVENFITQYLIAKRKSNAVMETQKQQLSKRNLYDTFKKYFAANFSDAESCLADMLRYAEFFRRLIFNDDTDFDKLSALGKKFYELVYLLDRHEQKHFDEATFIKFVDALISLVVRAKVCKHNGITQQFAGNVLARLDKAATLTEEIFWQAVTFGRGEYSFPNDADFRRELASNKLSDRLKGNACKYLLYSLERTGDFAAYSEYVVEYILPQRLNDWWKNYLRMKNDSAAHEIWLHNLGNMTLVDKADKSSGDSFDKKKDRYAQSNFSFTRTVSVFSDWTSKQIQIRAKKLAAEAVKIWTLPEEFNTPSLPADEIVTLDSDFAALKNSKPATLIISGMEIKISHWNHIVREVVRQLYTLDPDIFRRAAQMENLRKKFSVDPTDFKIDDDFYMLTGFDTKTCLRTIKVLAENFDMLNGGTNFKEEIYFTLRR